MSSHNIDYHMVNFVSLNFMIPYSIVALCSTVFGSKEALCDLYYSLSTYKCTTRPSNNLYILKFIIFG